jgi:hypothetical protein
LGCHREVRHAIIDIATVIRDLASRPTHVSELVQKDLDYVGYCDASAFGAGGVWFGGKTQLAPIVWQVQWPKDITTAVVSDSNPSGRLTNSDLEMAWVLLHEAVLEAQLGQAMAGTQIAIGSDNSPAVAWTTWMATQSTSTVSFHLVKGFAMRQRHTHSASPAVYHVAGTTNKLADVASRKLAGVATHFHLLENMPGTMCPDTFLTLFTNVQQPSALWSNAISTLRGQRLELRQWTTKLDARPGQTGQPMLHKPGSIPTCGISQSHSNKHTSLPLPPGFELASSGVQSDWLPICGKSPPSRGTDPPFGRI